MQVCECVTLYVMSVWLCMFLECSIIYVSMGVLSVEPVSAMIRLIYLSVCLCVLWVCAFVCLSVWLCMSECVVQPIPFWVTFLKALSKLKAQSSNVSFHWNVAKETFELWALSFERAFENGIPSGIGCIIYASMWVCDFVCFECVALYVFRV